MKKISAFLLLIVILSSCEYFEVGPAVYQIPLRTGADFDAVADPMDGTQKSKFPWIAFQPKPFRYQSDAQNKSEKDSSFVVGGLNCPTQLAQMKSISGVKIEDLGLRAKGEKSFTSISSLDPEFKFPAYWGGLVNSGLRMSAEGFLAKGQDFFKLLTEDNTWVLSQGFTHQKIAEPMLGLIERLEKAEKKGLPLKYTFNKKDFIAKPKQMGGRGSLQILRAMQLRKEELGLREALKASQIDQAVFDKALEALNNKRKEKPKWKSGWVGVGTQGSPFNDEIFSDYIVQLHGPDNKVVLVFDAMTPHLIYRYGFYQGGAYRIDPKRVVEVFGLVPDNKEGLCKEAVQKAAPL